MDLLKEYKEDEEDAEDDDAMPGIVKSVSDLSTVIPLTSTAVSLQKEDLPKLKEQTEKIVKLCLDHIFEIPNLIAFTKMLNSFFEYVHVVTSGKKCQDRINEKQKGFQKYEELKQEYEKLDNLRLQIMLTKDRKSGDTENVDAKLEAAKFALESLPKIGDLEKRNCNP